jgi:hypothetical protein
MYFNASDTVGQVVLSSSAIVGDSGKPQILYGYAFKSDTTAGVISFFDGTSSVAGSGTIMWDDTGIISATKVVPLSVGIMFPHGIFASFDGHVTPRATFWVKQYIS